VVSSDGRNRETASRRRATAITSERFWVSQDARRDRRVVAGKAGRVALPESTPNRVDPDLSAEDAAHWLATFGDLDDLPETREALAPDSNMLTDADVARIAREVDREFD
ncbi:MAG: hypothetical protein AB7I30_24070, partial [Isosphaeraceae bacterium]